MRWIAGGLVTNAVCTGGHGVKRCNFIGFLCPELLVWNVRPQLETEKLKSDFASGRVAPVEAHGRSFARSRGLQLTCHAHVS